MAKEVALPPPTPIALVVCDNVYTDSGGKRALIGLFNHIKASEFPAVHPRLCVFVSVTSLRPQTHCRLDIVHAETDEPVISMEGPLPSTSPTDICDIVFELRGIRFSEPGRYFIRFWGGNTIIVARPIEVEQATAEDPGEEDEDENEG